MNIYFLASAIIMLVSLNVFSDELAGGHYVRKRKPASEASAPASKKTKKVHRVLAQEEDTPPSQADVPQANPLPRLGPNNVAAEPPPQPPSIVTPEEDADTGTLLRDLVFGGDLELI